MRREFTMNKTFKKTAMDFWTNTTDIQYSMGHWEIEREYDEDDIKWVMSFKFYSWEDTNYKQHVLKVIEEKGDITLSKAKEIIFKYVETQEFKKVILTKLKIINLEIYMKWAKKRAETALKEFKRLEKEKNKLQERLEEK